jgi:signal transduction histidine kinase
VALEVPLGINVADRINGDVRSQAMAQAEVVAAAANDVMEPPELAKLDELAATNAKTSKGRVLIVDAQGRALSDSAGPGRTGADYSTRPEIEAAVGGQSSQIERYSETLKQDILATAVPVVHLGRDVGAVRITQSTSEIQASIQRAIVTLVAVGGLVLLLGLFAGWLIADALTRPMRQLEQTAESVSADDLSVRAEVTGPREQRALASAFNSMLERLAEFIEEQNQFLRDASHQLKTPVGAIRQRLQEIEVLTNDPEVSEQARKADETAVRMKAITDNMLHLAHLVADEDPTIEWLDLEAYAQQLVERWGAGIQSREPKVEIVLGPTATGAVSRGACTRDHLDTITDALIENSVAYSDGVGPIEISVIDHGLMICDRGPGLQADEMDAVFRRFYRGKAGQARPEGTGLGLAMAREIAQNMNGNVVLRNRTDGLTGAMAIVTLSDSMPAETEPSDQGTDAGTVI